MSMRLTAIAVAASFAAGALATSAGAVIIPFGGGATGTDPLGHAWVASDSHWGEPGFGNGDAVFNVAGSTFPDGLDYATSFSFTWLKGVDGVIDETPDPDPVGFSPYTRLVNETTGDRWLVSYSDAGKTVTFTAASPDDYLHPGDLFFVNVAFTGSIDPTRFSFAGLWDDQSGAVPEPASWAMMIAGFGMIGGALRASRRTVAFA